MPDIANNPDSTGQAAAPDAARTELEAELARVKPYALDPAGYARVKKCVRDNAEPERLFRDLARGGAAVGSGKRMLFLGPAPSLPSLLSKLPTPCSDALPYLKK